MEKYIITICETEAEINDLQSFYSNFTISEKNDLNIHFLDYEHYNKDSRFYKVEFENEIIGLGYVSNDKPFFFDFKRFIHPKHRSNKIGDKLLDFIIEDAQNLNRKAITGSFKVSEKATEYFKNKGFKISKFDETQSVLMLKLKKK